MPTLNNIVLTKNQQEGLEEIKRRLKSLFDIVALELFGSVVRGEADSESDIDLLVVSEQPLKREVRHQITDIVFEINLQYNTNFSTLVVDRVSWDEGIYSVLPIRNEILKEGIVL